MVAQLDGTEVRVVIVDSIDGSLGVGDRCSTSRGDTAATGRSDVFSSNERYIAQLPQFVSYKTYSVKNRVRYAGLRSILLARIPGKTSTEMMVPTEQAIH
jgi:hypothetical protein